MLTQDWTVAASGAHDHTSSTDTSTVRTVTLPANTKAVYLIVTGNLVYATFDGSTPSATNGLPISPSSQPAFFGVGKATIKWIGSSTAHSVDVLALTGA